MPKDKILILSRLRYVSRQGFGFATGMSMGFSAVEVNPPKGTKQSGVGTNKNETMVC